MPWREDWKLQIFLTVVPVLSGLAAGWIAFSPPPEHPMAVHSAGGSTTFTCETPPCRLTQADADRVPGYGLTSHGSTNRYRFCGDGKPAVGDYCPINGDTAGISKAR